MGLAAGQRKDSWRTRIGVILAVTGGAVGLGNFLRFPGLAAKYEGGAFMVPYFAALVFLGLPLAWAEWALGRYGGSRGFNSGPGIFRTIWPCRAAAYFGVLVLLVPLVVYMYYVFVAAWCLGYAWFTATGRLDLGPDKQAYIDFFADFVGTRHHGALFTARRPTLLFLGICFGLNLWLVYRGLSRGIEWFCRWAMPALVICALLVLLRVLTLGTPDPSRPELNVLNGLGFMWNPRTERAGFLESLANSQMWMEAAGQIFFSIAVGFGIIVTYASYLKPDDDIALSGLASCAGNEFCEVALGGMITVPAAFVFLGGAEVVASARISSFDLGFKTLPMIFHHMPLGRLAGTLFFLLLFLAALTSSVAMLQPAIALFEEGLGLKRRGSVAILGLVALLGVGFVVWFSKDLAALDTLDFWVGTFAIYLLATFQAILFGWVLGIERGMEELDRGAEIRIPRLFAFIIKYVSPVYLLGVFALWVYQEAAVKQGRAFRAIVENRVAALSIVLIAAVILLLIGSVRISLGRWERADQMRQAKETLP